MDTHSNLAINHYNRAALASVDSIVWSMPISSIAEVLVCVDVNDTWSRAVQVMKKNHFDVVGVREHGQAIGYVSLDAATRESESRPAGSIGHCTERLEKLAVDSSLSLLETLHGLSSSQRLFVRKDRTHHVDRIVTRADLQKAPVRMLVFGYITLLEIHLTDRIRETFPRDTWQLELGGCLQARKSEKKECLRRESEGEDGELLDCLDFSRKEDIIAGTPRLARECTPPHMEGEVLLSQVHSLRNALAHGRSLANRERQWADVAEIVSDVRDLNALLEGRHEQNVHSRCEEVS